MEDKQIGVNCLISSALWVLAIGLWGASVAYGARPPATLGIIVAMAASTMTIRGYLRDQSQRIKTAMVVTSAVPASVRSVP